MQGSRSGGAPALWKEIGGVPGVILTAVVPFRNEAESLPPLHGELVAALARIAEPWEIVYVDDGSSDRSGAVVQGFMEGDPRVRLVTLDRPYGQSTATVAGVEAAAGEWIATLDADGQNDPSDLPGLWRALRERNADGVQGVRRERHDSWVRKASSRIANTVRDRVTGDRVTDVGCSLRIVRRSTFLSAPRFEGMHRFLPTLLRMTGATIVERPVSHRRRRAGETKYGIHNRLWAGLYDLFMVRRLGQRWIRYRAIGGP
jgi:dolichol-phosphate mannosyltransferase